MELSPLIGDLGMGGISGLCVGYAVKKAAKVVAFFAGLYLLVLQYLAQKGVVTIHYDKLMEFGASTLSKVSNIGIRLAPTSVAFAGGFYLGLRVG